MLTGFPTQEKVFTLDMHQLRHDLETEKVKFELSFKVLKKMFALWDAQLERIFVEKPVNIIPRIFEEEEKEDGSKVDHRLSLQARERKDVGLVDKATEDAKSDDKAESINDFENSTTSETYAELVRQIKQQEMVRKTLDTQFKELSDFVQNNIESRMSAIEDTRNAIERQYKQLVCQQKLHALVINDAKREYEKSLEDIGQTLANLKFEVEAMVDKMKQQESSQSATKVDVEWMHNEIERRERIWKARFDNTFLHFKKYADELKAQQATESYTKTWCNSCA